jgi:hypothetical protein
MPPVPTATQRGPVRPPAPGDGVPASRGSPGRVTVDARAIAALVLLLPVAVIGISSWPGHMNVDTLSQIGGVSSGNITDHYAWLLAKLWRVVWPLGVNAGWILTVTLITFMVGSYLVLRAALCRIAAAVAAAIVALLPQNFGSLALVGRDMWFTAVLVLAFGLLVRATQRSGWRQVAFLAASVVAAVLAQAGRQNSITSMVVFFAGAAAVAYLRWGTRWRWAQGLGSARWRRLGGYAVVGVVASLVVAASLSVAKPALGVRSVHPEQYTYIYDLAALSKREGRVLFSREVFPANNLALLEQGLVYDSVVPLVRQPNPAIATPLPEEQVDQLRDDWRDAVLDTPLEYLDIRWERFMRQLAITEPPRLIYQPGIIRNNLGYQIHFLTANKAARDYVEAFADEDLNGTVLHAPWLYLLIALGAAVILLRSRAPALKIVGLMALAAITYQVGLFFAATNIPVRYEEPARFMALLAAIVAGASVISRYRLTIRASAAR